MKFEAVNPDRMLRETNSASLNVRSDFTKGVEMDALIDYPKKLLNMESLMGLFFLIVGLLLARTSLKDKTIEIPLLVRLVFVGLGLVAAFGGGYVLALELGLVT